MESAREARRRRIVERGSDRLAFITGESRSLPPPSHPPPKQEDPQRTAASLSEEEDASGFESSKHQASDQTVRDDAKYDDDDDSKELLKNYEANTEFPKDQEIEEFSRYKMGKQFPELDRNIEATTNAQDNVSAELSTTSEAHIPSDQVVDRAPRRSPQSSHQIFTPSRISRSISDTENVRIVCSIAIALLVVLSGHGYSLGGGSFVRNLIGFRPLFLVLLTDATVVLGRLLLITAKDAEDEARRRTTTMTGQEENGLGKALELGLVFQKALSAAFMDCSICAVIMISGLLV